jgi:hypothetical protein
MKFKYKRYGNGKFFRPVIPILLEHDGKEIGYEVLVDSGADLCIFDSQIGEAIGIDALRGAPVEIFGVGGKAAFYYLHPLTIRVGGISYEAEAGFMPSVGGRVAPYGVVGQKGFFDQFVVRFDASKEEVDLKPLH